MRQLPGAFNITIACILAFLFVSVSTAQTPVILSDTVYNMANTPAFQQVGTESFRGIEVDGYNRIWLGSRGSGTTGYSSFRFNGNRWDSLVGTVNQQVRAMKYDGHTVWIGMGQKAAQALVGGAYKFYGSTLADYILKWSSYQYSANNGLPSRYVNGLAYDPINDRVWSANGQSVANSITEEGGIAFLTGSAGKFVRVIAGLPSSDIRVLSIAVGKSEVLACVDRSCVNGNCSPVKINRYTLNGTYIGEYNASNTPIAFTNAVGGPTPRSLFVDSREWVWAGLSTGGIAVKDQAGWHLLTNPTIPLPANAAVNADVIKEDGYGNVWIGLTNGLLKFSGTNVLDSVSWKLYNLNGVSQTITGIAFDQNGNKWFATAAGVAMVPADSSNFELLTRSPFNGDYKKMSKAKPYLVAADEDDKATLVKWKGNPLAMFRIKEAAGNTDVYGDIISLFRSLEKVEFYYKHPVALNSATDFSFNVQLEAYNPFNGQTIDSLKLEIVRPPVLMLHGVFDNGNMWSTAKAKLISSGLYKSFQLFSPSYPNDKSFEQNTRVVPNNIDALVFDECQQNNLSFGKVDIVAHSMGGIVSRTYLQSMYYRKDINKLITLNTPHSGSPLPNLILNPQNSNLKKLISGLNSASGALGNPDGGALENMKLNSYATDIVLNSPGPLGRLNFNTAPSHAIVTTEPFNSSSSLGCGGRNIVLASIAYLTTIKGVSLFHLFNDDNNDMVVAEESQTGGLAYPFMSLFPNQACHSTSAEDPAVLQRVQDLLSKSKKDANFPAFTTNGYHPVNLDPANDPDLRRGLPQTSGILSTLAIVQPANGFSAPANQALTVEIVGSNIKHMMLIAGNSKLTAKVYDTTGNHGVFNYQIPSNAYGLVKLYVLAVDSANNQLLDSVYLTASTSSSVSTLKTSPVQFRVPKGGTGDFAVQATFSDGVTRDVTVDSTIVFQFADTTIAKLVNNRSALLGLKVGSTLLNYTFKGISASAYVEVVDSLLFGSIPKTSPPVILEAGYTIDSIHLTVCQNNSKSKCFNIYTDTGSVVYSIIQSPLHGTTAINFGSNSGFCVNYIPSANYSGPDKVRVKVCDRFGKCDTVLINYAVKPDNAGFVVTRSGDTLTSSLFGTSYQWYLNNAVRIGDTLFGIITSAPGSYKVQITDFDGCMATSAALVINSSSQTYTFNGSGNWSNASNWTNSVVPPSVLPLGSQISINPSGTSECILDVPQTISRGASLIVEPGKKLRINGNLTIQQ